MRGRKDLIEEVEHRLGYRRPNLEQQSRCASLREKAIEYSRTLVELSPEGRELSLALTKVEEALSHGIAAIVREETS